MVKKKIFPYELIGEKIEILHSKNKSNLGIKGKVIDETKMTLKIKWGEKVKTLLKNNITFKIVRNDQIITGQEIMKRPEEEIKGKEIIKNQKLKEKEELKEKEKKRLYSLKNPNFIERIQKKFIKEVPLDMVEKDLIEHLVETKDEKK